jgi:hypothetical protein
MAARIDLGSLIVAILVLAFTFNPQVVRFLSWINRLIRSWIKPSSTRCEQLLWRDIQPGDLHTHSGSGGGTKCTRCTLAASHTETDCCWATTLAVTFNNAWDNKTRKKWSKKPKSLPLDQDFIRTEAKVILAYFLTTARINMFSEELLGSRLDYIDLQQDHGLIIAHLGRAQRILELTKQDVERILGGWPPFYRETFRTIEGHTLTSPLTSFDHIRRPAWIVAIGLGTVQPTDVYVDSMQDSDRSLFTLPILRIKSVLENVFAQEWRGNSTVAAALTNWENMYTHGPSNGDDYMHTWKTDEALTVTYPDAGSVDALSVEQCEALMRVFDEMKITQGDKAIIDPVLGACLVRVLLGMQIALRYTSTNRVLKVPPLLHGDRVIYLRGCRYVDE